MSAALVEPGGLGGREGRFDLSFHRIGERTRLGRQYVSYPFHLTRPFTLDPEIPALTTVYQQSSSGGLYRADRLSSRIVLQPSAMVHLTTQAATVVHDCHGQDVTQTTELVLGAGSFLALTPDPLVTLPGAAVRSRTEVTLAEGAVALVSDAFARHSFDRRRPGPMRIAGDIAVRDAAGCLAFRDRWSLGDDALEQPDSPLGAFRISAGHLLLGPAESLPTREALQSVLEGSDAVAGVSALPNGIGWSVRVVARDAVAERRLATALFELATQAALGARPARRPK